MDHTRYLNSKPSIKLNIEIGGKKGTINLCSTYGCFDHASSVDIIPDDMGTFSCPSCKTELKGTDTCNICSAPMIDMSLDKGGKVSICSRAGCKKHYIAFEDISDAINNLYRDYNYGGGL
ncbi:MAG: hypothetical protein ACOCW8_02730 [bacterium]